MMTNKENAKVALVTGAGKRRVGNVIARMLAARGYQIALHYRRSAEAAEETVREIQSQGVRARAFQADVSRGAQVDRLFRETLDHFGRLDVLVTAAAVWGAQ